MHPGIDLEPDIDGCREPRLLQRRELPLLVDHDGKALLRRAGQVVGALHALQQKQRLGDAGPAQFQRFVEEADREPGRQVGERARHGHRAVAVGIGLDDSDRARIRCEPAGVLVIRPDRVEIDAGHALPPRRCVLHSFHTSPVITERLAAVDKSALSRSRRAGRSGDARAARRRA